MSELSMDFITKRMKKLGSKQVKDLTDEEWQELLTYRSFIKNNVTQTLRNLNEELSNENK